MAESKRITRDSLTYVVGEVLSKSMAFILLPIYINYLSHDEVGILLLVTTIWPVVAVFLGQSFTAYLMRGYFGQQEKERFAGTVILFTVFWGGLAAVIIHLTAPYTFGMIYKKVDYKPYLQYSVIFAFFRLYLIQVLTVFRAKRQPQKSVFLSFVLLLFNLASVLIAIFYLHGNVVTILRAQTIAYMVSAIVFTITVWPALSFNLMPRVIKPGLYFILPLIPHTLSGLLLTNTGRALVERHLTLAELSLFGVAAQLSLIPGVIANGLNQAWTPFLYENIHQPGFKNIFANIARKNLLLVLIIGAIVSIFTYDLLFLIGKEKYLQAANLVPVLTFTYFMQMLYFTYVPVLIYYKKTGLMPLISIISGAFALIMNMLLVPQYGMMGAAISTVSAFAVMAMLAYYYSRRHFKCPIISGRLIVFIALLLLMIIINATIVRQFEWSLQLVSKFVFVGLMIYLLPRLGLLNFKDLVSFIRMKV